MVQPWRRPVEVPGLKRDAKIADLAPSPRCRWDTTEAGRVTDVVEC